jgi:hypothetical protein
MLTSRSAKPGGVLTSEGASLSVLTGAYWGRMILPQYAMNK